MRIPGVLFIFEGIQALQAVETHAVAASGRGVFAAIANLGVCGLAAFEAPSDPTRPPSALAQFLNHHPSMTAVISPTARRRRLSWSERFRGIRACLLSIGAPGHAACSAAAACAVENGIDVRHVERAGDVAEIAAAFFSREGRTSPGPPDCLIAHVCDGTPQALVEEVYLLAEECLRRSRQSGLLTAATCVFRGEAASDVWAAIDSRNASLKAQCEFRPPQTYEMHAVDKSLIATTSLFCQNHVRVDQADALHLPARCFELGAHPCVFSWHFVTELCYKMGMFDKFGA